MIKDPKEKEANVLNVYTPNSRDSNSVKQNLKELKREIDKSVIIVGDFSPTLPLKN